MEWHYPPESLPFVGCLGNISYNISIYIYICHMYKYMYIYICIWYISIVGCWKLIFADLTDQFPTTPKSMQSHLRLQLDVTASTDEQMVVLRVFQFREPPWDPVKSSPQGQFQISVVTHKREPQNFRQNRHKSM